MLIAITLAGLQAPAELPSYIQVTGTGTVSTLPDRADIAYSIAGEGKTPDEATAALSNRQKEIVAGIDDLLGGAAKVTTSQVYISEVRLPECDPNGYNGRPRLSVGACAVTGYVATLQGMVRTSAVSMAGTAVGVVGRLGARDARIQQFRLADPAAAMRRATAAAIADARTKGEAMASAAGVGLGDVLNVSDQSPNDNVIAQDIALFSNEGLRRVPVSIAVPLSPEPIETRTRIFVRFLVRR